MYFHLDLAYEANCTSFGVYIFCSGSLFFFWDGHSSFSRLFFSPFLQNIKFDYILARMTKLTNWSLHGQVARHGEFEGWR
jgi:hypothetical protein